MTRTAASLSFALVASSLCVPAVAQTRFCIGGDLDHLSATDRASCSALLEAARGAAAVTYAPEGWHFVVVCGEEGWKQYAAFSKRDEGALANAAVETDRAERTTYFREASLRGGGAHGLQQSVAHEVATIVLRTENELAIQAQMASWERHNLVQTAAVP